MAEGICHAQVEGCTKIATDPHHWWPKGRGGPLLPGETQKLIPVCRNCHDFIGDNPRLARKMGLLK